jgi:hypothetical protein
MSQLTLNPLFTGLVTRLTTFIGRWGLLTRILAPPMLDKKPHGRAVSDPRTAARYPLTLHHAPPPPRAPSAPLRAPPQICAFLRQALAQMARKPDVLILQVRWARGSPLPPATTGCKPRRPANGPTAH